MSPALTDVPGFAVGHWTDAEAATGCTVVLTPPDGAVGAAHVRGRATGTRELDALRPGHIAPRVHAILLTGGSAYGLGAADGVMAWLRRRGRGFAVGSAGIVPIVPTAVIFDLGLGAADRWPRHEDAVRACEEAGSGVGEGSVGVGTGATVGKMLGAAGAMKGGVGTWAARVGDLIVGALVVVNAIGDVRDGAGVIIAGARRPDGRFADAARALASGEDTATAFAGQGANTTLAVVACNGRLDRHDLKEIARMAGDALARHITPVGTAYDGDIVFALAAGDVAVRRPLQVELLAQQVLGQAIERSVRLARGLAGVPGCADRM